MKKRFTLLFVAFLSFTLLVSQSRPASLRHSLLAEIQNKTQSGQFTSQDYQRSKKPFVMRSPSASYATQMRLDSIVGEFYDDEDTYREKEVYVYNANDHLSEESWYEYDVEAGAYVTDGKYVYEFDAFNRMIKKSRMEIADNGEWVEESRTEFSYLANGNLASETQFYTDQESGAFYHRYKTEYSYNASGRLTLTLEMQYYLGQQFWATERKNEYIYNNADLLLEIRSYRNTEWQEISWERTDGSEMTYDAAGNMLTRKYYTWNSLINQPVYSSQNTYAYDNQNRRVESVWESLDGDSKYKEQMSYDAQGNLLTIIESEWSNASWVVSFKVAIEVNLQYSRADLILPFWLTNESDLAFNNMLTSYSFYYTGDDGEWINEGVYQFYYSEKAPSRTDAAILLGSRLMKNPVGDYLLIELIDSEVKGAINVVDMQGRVLIAKPMSSDAQLLSIDVQLLSPGIYFYRLIGNGRYISGKFVKQ